ncbi:MAG: biotin holocarboxylase synthetase [Alyxoria varia]|nr:MAG: biotin holocarboxylase synthetase [Alyxoria varia]
MSTSRINVLVYSDSGSTPESIRHTLTTLRKHLHPHHAVSTITAKTLLDEPWPNSTALLVFPGGADLPYCRALNGAGNRRIRWYVEGGGRYLGLCAGGYYGSGRCEFEIGRKDMEVVGDRELGFYPGMCRGSAFQGFVYDSEVGTRAARVKVRKDRFAAVGVVPEGFRSYANGGGVFVNPEKWKDRGVELLATYEDSLAVDAGEDPAAAVYCKVGDGAALLTGTHPEFSASNFSKKAKDMDPAVKRALEEDDKLRESFIKAALLKLGLHINQDEDGGTLSLSPIHLSSNRAGAVAKVSAQLESNVEIVDGNEYVKAETDTFQIHRSSSTWSMSKLTRAAIEALSTKSKEENSNDTEKPSEEGADPSEKQTDLVKTIVLHEDGSPSAQDTPYFNHSTYFSALSVHTPANDDHHNDNASDADIISFGQHLLYAEVITSTSTLLEKNPKLTNHLPAGTTLTATRQLSGRGRGSNIWLSPAGSLMFSTVFTHPLALNTTAPLVFVQYLAGMAVVEGIQSYVSPDGDDSSGHTRSKERNRNVYENVPVKLKWPNDIYALAPTSDNSTATTTEPQKKKKKQSQYTKIGGILVNTSYTSGEFVVILGIGLNVSNTAPTTSLNALVQVMNGDEAEKGQAAVVRENVAGRPSATARDDDKPHTEKEGEQEKQHRQVPPFAPEPLLAAILSRFRHLYAHFRKHGFDSHLEQQYYSHWLHSGQVVALDEDAAADVRDAGAGAGATPTGASGETRARIKGVTRDWGLLLADEVVEVDVGADGIDGGDGGIHEATAGDGRRYRNTGKTFALQSDSNSFDFMKGLLKRKV